MEEKEEFKRIRRQLRRALAMPIPAELIEQIQSAFANTKTPEADTIITCPCDECQAVKRRFQGKHWTEITDPRYFHRHDVSLGLLEAEAFRFYLPAYLLGDLQNLGGEKRREDYTFHLTPPKTEGAEAESFLAEFGITHLDYFTSRVRGFSPEQKEALKAYLRFSFRRRPASYQIEELEHQRTLDFWDTFVG